MARNPNASRTSYSGYFLAFEPARTEKVAERLHNPGEASESFSAMDWKFERREVALLSLEPGEFTIGALVLMDRMHGSGGTGTLKMRMWSPVIIEDPIKPGEIADEFPAVDRLCTAERFKRIPSIEWPLVLEAIKRVRPALAKRIDALVAMREKQRHLAGNDKKIRRLTEQRDAIGLALDIASLNRKAILRKADLSHIDAASSALELLDAEPLQEQDLIRQDQRVFKGLLKLDDFKAARFEGTGDREVRVYVYDKKPLETVLGIDLLIFLADFKSYLLLQYKCMEPKSDDHGKTWSYLVDPQLSKQIKAMDTAMNAIRLLPMPASTSMRDWRLSEETFYFKFCETTSPDARDDALVAGITLGHSHLKRFLELPEAIGANGGKRIGYSNCPRYLNNTQFVDLAREGWIGCDQRGYALISAVIKAGQADGRRAMYAVIKGSGAKTAADRRKRIQ
ncbi:hypothetical protein KAK06_22005 [Ideonella sp. 4Y11]|uniref:Uncharacterized protein n=1 Tax=Ideonella aquatica TaxID=2824119 RepID=A0A940YYS8_9BURK|nr:hypothetical protein [Ideonella aquatica]MBQ0961630.1 hypothetical protein [Ideonella aquatica]